MLSLVRDCVLKLFTKVLTDTENMTSHSIGLCLKKNLKYQQKKYQKMEVRNFLYSALVLQFHFDAIYSLTFDCVS